MNAAHDCIYVDWEDGLSIVKTTGELYYNGEFPFTLEESEDGNWEISEYKGIEANLTIPAKTPWGEKITVVGCECLMGNTAVKTVTIESGVEEIEGWAFDSCPNLTDIYIPASVTNIKDYYAVMNMWPTIHGVRGSYAQSWAEDEGYTFKPGKIS